MSLVIDAHHHLIDPARTDYPWITAELAAIDRRFGPEDLAPELAAAGIDRTILVQTISSIEETRDFLEIASRTPFIVGVIGWIDLTDPDAAVAIDRLRAGPGGDRLVGIRHQVHDEPDPAWLLRPDVGRGLTAVEEASLSYDLLVRPRELAAALTIARARPGLRLVIDHLAKPPIRSGELEPWRALLRPFGELGNVWCKVSGLVTEADWTTWEPGELGPYVESAIEIFGPSRLIFGSDWPVCLLAASYGRVVSVARGLSAALSETDRDALFGGSAVRAYSLSIPPDRVG